MTVKTLIITGYGINSDYELARCFEIAGSQASRVHINDLISGSVKLSDFHIIGFPGGFSFGDHIGSGKIFANKFKLNLGKDLLDFVANGRPVIGICNGFQVLVKMGLLPFGDLEQAATLTLNNSGLFEDRWVRLKINPATRSIWLKDIDYMDMPVRHGEGKFICPDDSLKRVTADSLDALFYTDENGKPTEAYPANPNGSAGALAGITDASGLVLGLMPHPEAFMIRQNHYLWKSGRRGIEGKAAALLSPQDGGGMAVFYNAVNYVRSKA